VQRTATGRRGCHRCVSWIILDHHPPLGITLIGGLPVGNSECDRFTSQNVRIVVGPSRSAGVFVVSITFSTRMPGSIMRESIAPRIRAALAATTSQRVVRSLMIFLCHDRMIQAWRYSNGFTRRGPLLVSLARGALDHHSSLGCFKSMPCDSPASWLRTDRARPAMNCFRSYVGKSTTSHHFAGATGFNPTVWSNLSRR
jgi:hypothetical protein